MLFSWSTTTNIMTWTSMRGRPVTKSIETSNQGRRGTGRGLKFLKGPERGVAVWFGLLASAPVV